MIFSIGEAVEWHHEARGGYGYSWWVPATVVKVTAKRVVVSAALAAGGTKQIAVKPEKLRKKGGSS